ncbi:hypothetical protein M440DRAFT_1173667 [Trichoderma longibrachiatum ATCC 18648]|uniref:Uncharacterized protein n=1 Tax=Trichoderma longibrachiatum ATCC 18648 TaxID=983965 RepID=A0A2T4CDD6_TRILO|nr:hypothetical protein M440DRAFT_1173667 [Trichoderma longibrachiatum ATCC 18648]
MYLKGSCVCDKSRLQAVLHGTVVDGYSTEQPTRASSLSLPLLQIDSELRPFCNPMRSSSPESSVALAQLPSSKTMPASFSTPRAERIQSGFKLNSPRQCPVSCTRWIQPTQWFGPWRRAILPASHSHGTSTLSYISCVLYLHLWSAHCSSIGHFPLDSWPIMVLLRPPLP